MSSACYPAESWRDLLSGDLSDVEANGLRAHLSICSACTQRLEEFSTPLEWRDWAGAKEESLRALARQAPPPELLQRLRELLVQPTAGFETVSHPTEPISGPDHRALDRDMPARLGSYRLMGVLGQGGMGVVYKAYDEGLARLVALKVLRAGRDSDSARTRFVREAQAAAALNHDHIVSVHAVSAPADGAPYLIMEYVEGPTLRERIRDERRLGPKEAADICRQIAQGLAAAHHARLVHRDIKPSNIILDRVTGRAKIMDFGLVRALEQHTDLTGEGVVVGTPQYMSPEHVRAPALVDERSDVYSLGATLYEALTGEVPVRGEQFMMLQQIVNDEPAPPSRLHSAVPRDLEIICLKAMAKEPSRRYQTAAALAEDLGRWLREEPILARPAGRREKLWRWSRRNPLVAGLTAAVATLLLVVAVGAVAAALWQHELADIADRDRRTAEDLTRKERRAREDEVKAHAEADAQRVRFAGLLEKNYADKAAQLLDQADLYQALPWVVEGLKLTRTEPQREQLHRQRFAAVLRQAPRALRVWFHDGLVYQAKFSPDGRRLATASADGSARVWDPATGKPVTGPLWHEAAITVVAFSHDSKRVVTAGSDSSARVWDAASGQPITGWLRHQAEVASAAFSADDRQVVTASLDKTARVWDATTGKELQRLQHGNAVTHAVFSPDSSRIATASVDGLARIWEPTTGKTTELKHDGKVFHVCFSPDGRRLASGAYPWARVWDAVSGQPVSQPLAHVTNVVHVAFDAKGQRLVTASSDSEARVWDVASSECVAILRHGNSVRTACFSPDGQRVLTACMDGAAWLWPIVQGAKPVAACQHAGAVLSAVFSPDGRTILTASHDETARLWEWSKPFAAEAQHDQLVYHGAFSPDGRSLATASWDRTAQIWDSASALPRFSQPLRHNSAVRRVRFSRDGGALLTATVQGDARVWDAATGQPVTDWLVHGGQHLDAIFSPDGRSVVTFHATGTCRVWDAKTGKEITPPPLRQAVAVEYAAMSPDGAYLVTTHNDAVARVWAMASGQQHHMFKFGNESNVKTWAAFSCDGRVLVTVFQRTAQAWEPASGRPIGQPLEHTGKIIDLAFSRDGRYLVTASEDQTARVWDIAKSQLISQVKHRKRVERVDFSPDGHWVVTASLDGSARVWEASTGQPVTPPLRHEGPVWHAAFSPDGHSVLTTGSDGKARVWDLTPEKRPLEDLVALTQVLTGLELGEPGKFAALDVTRFRVHWAKLHAKYPHALTSFPKEEMHDWEWRPDLRQATNHARLGRWKEAEVEFTAILKKAAGNARGWKERGDVRIQLKNWNGAIADFTRAIDLGLDTAHTRFQRSFAAMYLNRWGQVAADADAAIKFDPGQYSALCLRGHAHAQFGHWKQAADDYSQALSVTPKEPAFRCFRAHLGYCLATLKLHKNDVAGYRQLCARLADKHGHVHDSELAFYLLNACMLHSDPVAPERLLEWAATCEKCGAPPSEKLYVAAVAHYRAGQFKEAVRLCEESQRRDASAKAKARVAPVLALAHHRLGQAGEARRWLAHGDRYLEEQRQQLASDKAIPPDWQVWWPGWLHLQFFQREAQALLSDAPVSPGRKAAGRSRASGS